jgi:hypothetical protein
MTMRLSDFLTGVGRPVAYYPGLRRITGSTNATIFICQLVYWTGKESSGDGWIYKTSDEIEEETGLSYKEQTTAREKLIAAGLLEERYARLEHRIHFKVNLDALNSLWDSTTPTGGSPTDQGDVPETPVGKMGKRPLVNSLISNTETTTETTTDNHNQTAHFIPIGSPEEKKAIHFFVDHLGKFHGETEVKRWLAIVDAVGMRQAETIAAWAEKREIHLDNRPGLMDSLETAAKNWSAKKQPIPYPDKGSRAEFFEKLARA